MKSSIGMCNEISWHENNHQAAKAHQQLARKSNIEIWLAKISARKMAAAAKQHGLSGKAMASKQQCSHSGVALSRSIINAPQRSRIISLIARIVMLTRYRYLALPRRWQHCSAIAHTQRAWRNISHRAIDIAINLTRNAARRAIAHRHNAAPRA